MPFVKIGLAVVLLGPLSFVTFMMFKVWPFGADVPLLRTPEWKDKHIGELYSGRLQLRRETEAGGALLSSELILNGSIDTTRRYALSAPSRIRNGSTQLDPWPTVWTNSLNPAA